MRIVARLPQNECSCGLDPFSGPSKRKIWRPHKKHFVGGGGGGGRGSSPCRGVLFSFQASALIGSTGAKWALLIPRLEGWRFEGAAKGSQIKSIVFCLFCCLAASFWKEKGGCSAHKWGTFPGFKFADCLSKPFRRPMILSVSRNRSQKVGLFH